MIFFRRRPRIKIGDSPLYYFPGGLGDLVLLTSSFKYLRQRGKHIVLATKKRYFPLLQLPYIDRLMECEEVDRDTANIINLPSVYPRYYPRVEAFAIMLRAKVESPPEISVILQHEESYSSKSTSVVPELTDLETAVGLIRRSYMHIGTNSGLMHVAGALKKKGLVLCGKEDGSLVFGCYPRITIRQSRKKCSPCWGYNVCPSPSCLLDIALS